MKLAFLNVLFLLLITGSALAKINPENAIIIQQVHDCYSEDLVYCDSLTTHYIKEAKKAKNFYLALSLSIDHANIKNRLFQIKEAFTILFETIRKIDSLGYEDLKVKAYASLGNKYNYIEQFEEAHRYTYKAVQLSNANTNDFLKAYSLYYFANSLSWSTFGSNRSQKELYCDSALKIHNRALELVDPDNYLVGDILIDLSNIHYTMNNIELARNLNQQSYRAYQKSNYNNGVVATYPMELRILIREGRYAEVIKIAEKGFKLAEQLNDLHHLQQISQNMYVAFQVLGKYEKACQYMHNYFSLRMKQNQGNRAGAIYILESQFQLDQKDQQLDFQNQLLSLQSTNLEVQQNLTVGISVVLLISVIFSSVYYRLFRKNIKISHQNTVLLREQSHRVKNNLQVISALLNLQANRLQEPGAKAAIEDSHHRLQVMSMIHQRLYGENLVEINIKELIKDISQMMIHSLWPRENNLQTEYELDDIYLLLEKAVPIGLIVNELITNSLKHAFADHQLPKIKIRLQKISRQKIQFFYSDNGPGFNSNEHETQQSFGLLLIHLQSRQLFGNYHWQNGTGSAFNLEFKV